ncbi:helix-turn-helix domain-containing protein [Paractinoplanes brasiliensis]|uniref:MarR family protein n=1 Tax=Paractinoplanes brasiliensis TaxID=52695 RepID=A0A4R6JB15_9ACTN|nr:helix-turn-helix domain-containing protein [Actinoplanes brasiliensis]TDO32894.1 MarR family protein [Actinoplanes brasiliensis]GID28610.1 MarR family transcriptional regulator [Actinoplanes brasiliensis]
MPGRRLTSDDRQRIAVGLAQGRNFAEIAGDLARPTSTVSREVARNGGPGRYRAELAQLATVRRARRRAPVPGRETPVAPAGPDPDARIALVTDLTTVLIDTGLPRTAARVLACLFTAETGSATTAELTEQLRISPATVSLAVGLLEQHGLIRRSRDGRSRRHRYFLDEDAGVRSAVVSVRANQRLADTVLRGADILGDGTAAGARLAAAGRFLEQLGDTILRFAEQHRLSTRSALVLDRGDPATARTRPRVGDG